MGIAAEKSGSHGDSEQEQLYGSACGCVKNSYLKRIMAAMQRSISFSRRNGTDCRFPVEILRHLPYPCIYLETPELGNKEYHGFFVYLDQKMDKSMFMLRFISISKEGAIRDNYDLELEIVKIMAMMKLENKWSSDELMQKMEERKTILLGLVQLLLYICADEPTARRNRATVPDKYPSKSKISRH